jgi:probable HAF family extracellular repeat protein
MLHTWLKGLTQRSGAARGPRRARPWQCPHCYRLELEALEERYLLDYSITLVTLGGFESYAYGINNVGQVTGASYTAGNTAYHAFFRDTDGTITDLGALGGYYSVGSGINNAGQVAGWLLFYDLESFHAVRWDSNGSITDLDPGGFESYAYGINDAGQVAGTFTTVNAVHAARWNSDGTKTDLGTLGGSNSYAYSINNAGQVAGYSYPAGDAFPHAVLWGSDGAITDLGTVDGCCSRGAAINDSGQVAGSASPGYGPFHAAIWNPDGTATDLGTLGGDQSGGIGINSAGQIVGSSTIPSGATHAAFWDGDGTITDLNSQIPGNSGWELYVATGINEAGQIVGWGRLNGSYSGFLLTPNPSPAARPPSAAAQDPVSVSLPPTRGTANNAPTTPLHPVDEKGLGGGMASGMFSLSTVGYAILADNQAVGGAAGRDGTSGEGVGGGTYSAAGSVCARHTRITGNHASTSNDDVFGDLDGW